MTTLVIDLGDIAISDRLQVMLIDEMKRTALASLSRLRADEKRSVRVPDKLWTLMLHGRSHGYWNVDDNPRVG